VACQHKWSIYHTSNQYIPRSTRK